MAYSLGKVRHARRDPGAAAQGPPRQERRADVKPGGLVKTTVGRVLFNAMLPDGMPFYNMPLRCSRPGRRDLRLLRNPRPPQDHRPAGHDEPPRLPPEHAQRPELRHRRPDHPAQQVEDHRQRREARAEDPRSSTSAASSPRASATTRCWTPGPTPANKSPPK